MFDALRRAEQERKRRGSRAAEPLEKPTVMPASELQPLNRSHAPSDVSPVVQPQIDPFRDGDAGLPEDFLRELGILRNSIDAILGNTGKRSILFAGSLHEEGATTLASSYANLLGMTSRERVLLIEMNARRPSLFWRMGLSSPEGVTHLFSGQSQAAAVIQATAAQHFDVLHVGEKDPTKIQLHLEAAFPQLLENALKSYDVVIVDAPPIVLSPETPPMASMVDGVVVVVQCGKTKREVVQRALGMIGQCKGKVLGLVLNRKKYHIPDFIYRRL